MKKEAFTLLELIFVIVIIGTLSSVAMSSFKPHHLRNDINFVLMKLEETRYQAMGYDKSLPSGNMNYSIGCINIDDLNDTRDKDTNAKAYKFYSSLENKPLDVICFDTLGREHNGTKDGNKTELSSLLENDVNLTYGYQGKNGTLIIDHLTGNIRTMVQN